MQFRLLTGLLEASRALIQMGWRSNEQVFLDDTPFILTTLNAARLRS